MVSTVWSVLCGLNDSLSTETTAFQVVHTQEGLEGIPLVVESLRYCISVIFVAFMW